MIRRAMVLALCAVFLSAPVNAQQACTEMGCMNGLIIQVDPQMSWPRGHYTLQFLINNKTQVECKGKLPLKSCEEGPTFSCDVGGVRVGESGCALHENAHGLADIYIEAIPHKVVLNILKDGQIYLSRTFEPEYKTFRPNGPSCEPECTGGTVSLNKEHLSH